MSNELLGNHARVWLLMYLQILDFLSTVAFMNRGVSEANIVVRFFISAASDPITGVLCVKLAGVALVAVAWKFGKMRLIALATRGYAILIVWNLVALIVAMAA